MSIVKKMVRSFLWRTGIGRKAGQLFWKKKDKGPELRYLLRNSKDLFEGLPIAFEDERYNRFLEEDLKKWRMQEEYILEMDKVLVDPERCLGIQHFNELIDQTIVFKEEQPYPYILPYLLRGNREHQLERALLYDGSATRNYFHHLVDALSMLYMFRRSGLPADLPVIVNRFVYDKSFFQHLLKRSPEFRSFNWHILEPGDWTRVQKLYKTKSYVLDEATWQHTRRLYCIEDGKPFRKVFLNRDKKLFTRGLSNEAAVMDLLEKYGFETRYAEHMSVDDQQQLFQETKYLVALTGMGLIQQFFMNYSEAHVLEIIPLNRLMPEYYCQAFTMGIKYYDVLLGEAVSPELPDGSYQRIDDLKEYPVDLRKLETFVVRERYSR